MHIVLLCDGCYYAHIHQTMNFVFDIIVIVFSAILHEVSHGLAARALGDKTAEYAGRLTLNPLAHIDIYGSFLLPLLLWVSSGGRFLFAYAKPVPYNPYNLRNQQWGPAFVGVAGPATNFLIAIVMAIIIRFTALGTSGTADFLVRVLVINVSLGVFNMVPLPPLDGSKVLFALLPPRYDHIKYTLERYGMILVMVFIFFFSAALYPIMDWIVGLLLG